MRILTFILLLVFPFIVNGQGFNIVAECCDDGAERICTTYSYNGANLVAGSTIQINDENISQVSNSYDANGNLTAKTSRIWNGTAWVIMDQVTTSYNAAGQITGQTVKTGDGMGGVVNVTQVSNSYDINGNLSATTNREWDGSAWVITDQVTTS